MNFQAPAGRWPPTYDFDTLATQIREIVGNRSIFNVFFTSATEDAERYQGDIVSFSGNMPIIDAEGDVSVIDDIFEHWMIIGNTCDLSRIENDESCSHISPLVPITEDTPSEIILGLQGYKNYKKFFIPNWANPAALGYYIDFTLICSINKFCLFENCVTVARLNWISWLLLHSCLVRYLARDDGRNE
jgi:hypothetical protein